MLNEGLGKPDSAAAPKENSATDFGRIDHIAIAVRDLETAVTFYVDVLGFSLECTREIKGARTGMRSAELRQGSLKLVLCQGTEPTSQVSQLIEHYGPGVAHVAIEVRDVQGTVDKLKSRGLDFDTPVIGDGQLQQAFSSRDDNSGMSFEFIRRTEGEGFSETNIQQLFEELERSGSY